MRRIFILFQVIAFSGGCFAQSIEDKFTKKTFTCKEAQDNCSLLIPKYYFRGDLDTVRVLMNYWDEKCRGGGEPLTRLKILLSIQGDTLSENLYDYYIIPNLYTYRELAEAKRKNKPIDENNRWISKTESPEVFDSLTVFIATQLRQKQELNPLEQFFVNFYSNDYENALAQLKTSAYDTTKLQGIYYQHVNRFKGKPDYNVAFYLGAWSPQADLKILGIHPVFGFERGVRFKRVTLDGEMNYKFLKTPQTYKVQHADSVWDSKKFSSFMAGLKLGLDILQKPKHNINIFGSAAYENTDVLDVKFANMEKLTKHIVSFPMSYGFRYRLMVNIDGNYMGFELRNTHQYLNNPGGTKLTGNAITFTLIFGGLHNNSREERLKLLDAAD